MLSPLVEEFDESGVHRALPGVVVAQLVWGEVSTTANRDGGASFVVAPELGRPTTLIVYTRCQRTPVRGLTGVVRRYRCPLVVAGRVAGEGRYGQGREAGVDPL